MDHYYDDLVNRIEDYNLYHLFLFRMQIQQRDASTGNPQKFHTVTWRRKRVWENAHGPVYRAPAWTSVGYDPLRRPSKTLCRRGSSEDN